MTFGDESEAEYVYSFFKNNSTLSKLTYIKLERV